MKKKIIFLMLLLPILALIIYKTTISDEKSNISVTSSPSSGDVSESSKDNSNDSPEKTELSEEALSVFISNISDGSVIIDRTPTVSGTFTSENTPTISISFFNEDEVAHTGHANVAHGSWTYTPSSTLPYGKYQIKATITNGTTTSTNTISNLTISETKKLTISIGENDTLTLNKYNPIISGTSNAIDGVSAFVTIENTTVVTTVEAGVWSIQWPETLLEGEYEVYVSILEQDQSAEDHKTITIDKTSPHLKLTNNNSTITNDSTPTISGITDEISGANVYVSINNKSYSTKVKDDGSWSLDTDQLEDGEYEVKASIADMAKNTATDSKTITIDTTGPIISITSPSVTFINKKNLNVSGTIDEGDTLILQFADKNNNVVFSKEVAVQDNKWSLTPNLAIPDGSYTITAIAKDRLNNLGSDSISITIDVTNPSLAFDADIAYITNDVTPTISGTTDEDDGSTVTIIVDGTSYNAKVQSGIWSVTTHELQEGDYQIQAMITDEAGNKTKKTQSIKIDVTPPSLIIEGGEDRSTNDSTPTLHGTTDARDGTLVSISLGNDTFETKVSEGNWQLQLPELADGEYIVTVSIADEAGNRTIAKQALTVDTIGPDVSITSPAIDSYTNNNKTLISGAVDSEGDYLTIAIYDNKNKLSVEEKLQITSKTWKLELEEPLIDGTYKVVVKAYDELGNEKSATTTFNIDTVAPKINFSNLSNESTIIDDTPIIEGTTSPNSKISLEISQGDELVLEHTITSDDEGYWNFEVQDSLMDNDYKLSVSVKDLANNKGELSSLFTIDTKAPEVSIVSPNNGSVFYSNDIKITGISSVGSIVNVKVNNEENIKLKTNQFGVWSYELENTLAVGAHEIVITAEDIHGNVSAPINRSFKLVKEDTKQLLLTTETPAIIGNGTDFTTLTATLIDIEGQPLENVEVLFSAPIGFFPDGFEVKTNEDGVATVKYASVNIENEKSQSITVSAFANDPSVAFIGEKQITIVYEPVISAIVGSDTDTNKPINDENDLLSTQKEKNTSSSYVGITIATIILVGLSILVFIVRRKK